MVRKKNPVESNRLYLTTTRGVLAYLDQIVETEIFGKNRAEVADRLIARGIEELVRSGVIDRIAKKNPKGEKG